MNPFFSIVLVNYNSAEFLEQAILSVINQDCKDFEFIIVDGGSTDNSLSIINKYTNYLSWWVSEPDKGQSDAFNKGFSHARGQFYTWVNADDLMLPGTLRKVKEYVLDHPDEKWLAVNTVYIDNCNLIRKCIKGVDYCNWILRHGLATEVAPSTFFHKNLFDEFGPFRLECHLVMDTDLWLRFIKSGYRYKRLNHFGWAFRIHEASKTSSSLEGKPTQKFLDEVKEMMSYNDVKLQNICLLYQKIKKVFFNYPFSCWKTLKYRDKNVLIMK